MRSPPRRLSGVEILEQAQNIKVTFGKKKKGNSPTKKEYVLNNVHRRKYHFTVGIVVLLFVIQLCKPDFCYIYHCVSVIP